MDIIPITKVILKDGRIGTVRLSHTAIKHCKRHGLGMTFSPDVGGNCDIHANKIKSILSDI